MNGLFLLSLLMAPGDPCGEFDQAREQAQALEYVSALATLRPLRTDKRCSVELRAQAWMLSAQVWYALGEDPSARYSAKQAFLLDPLSEPEGEVPVILADLIAHERAWTVGDAIKPQDRTGGVVDLSQRYPIKVSVPSGEEPLIEVRVGGTWEALEVKKLPSGRGKLFGARLPPAMRSLSSVSYRFDIGGDMMGPFQRKLAQAVTIDRRKARDGGGKKALILGGLLLGVAAGGAAVFFMNQEPEGCVTNPGMACIELRIRR